MDRITRKKYIKQKSAIRMEKSVLVALFLPNKRSSYRGYKKYKEEAAKPILSASFTVK